MNWALQITCILWDKCTSEDKSEHHQFCMEQLPFKIPLSVFLELSLSRWLLMQVLLIRLHPHIHTHLCSCTTCCLLEISEMGRGCGKTQSARRRRHRWHGLQPSPPPPSSLPQPPLSSPMPPSRGSQRVLSLPDVRGLPGP